MSNYYDKAGKPIDMMTWVRLFEDREYKVIEKTPVGALEVSTVWLGSDHDFSGKGPPIIFETLVFPDCEDGERYCTETEAREGHARYVEKWTKEMNQ